jgi:hypothetical protein
MQNGLARFQPRYARYTLSPIEDSFIRVAGPNQTPWEEDTEILNISLTGLAFTAPLELAPKLGEVIKIEFKSPEQQKMACYAIVSRLESMRTENVLIGIRFYKMTMPQRIGLATGLAQKLKEQIEKNEKKQKIELFKNIITNPSKFVFWLMGLTILSQLYFFAEPSRLIKIFELLLTSIQRV